MDFTLFVTLILIITAIFTATIVLDSQPEGVKQLEKNKDLWTVDGKR
jgi:hypothetical protein